MTQKGTDEISPENFSALLEDIFGPKPVFDVVPSEVKTFRFKLHTSTTVDAHGHVTTTIHTPPLEETVYCAVKPENTHD